MKEGVDSLPYYRVLFNYTPATETAYVVIQTGTPEQAVQILTEKLSNEVRDFQIVQVEQVDVPDMTDIPKERTLH